MFSCTGLLTSATCSFTPPTATFTANAAPEKISLAVETLQQTARNTQPDHQARTLAMTFWLPGLLLAGLSAGRKGRLTYRRLLLLAVLCVTLGGVAALVGCGSGSSSTKSPVGTTTFNVVATSGSSVQTVPVTLSITP